MTAPARDRRDQLIDVREQRDTAKFEVRSQQDELILTGYASTFEPYQMYGGPAAGGWIEQIDPHAFDVTLRGRPDLNLLINHQGMPLARTKSGTLTLSVDSRGLRVEARLDRRDPDVQRLEPKMRRGDMTEMSFAFTVKHQAWSTTPEFPNDDRAKRTILEVSLHKGDVSVVNYGANPTTSAEIQSKRRQKMQGRRTLSLAEAESIAMLDAKRTNTSVMDRARRILDGTTSVADAIGLAEAGRIAADRHRVGGDAVGRARRILDSISVTTDDKQASPRPPTIRDMLDTPGRSMVFSPPQHQILEAANRRERAQGQADALAHLDHLREAILNPAGRGRSNS